MGGARELPNCLIDPSLHRQRCRPRPEKADARCLTAPGLSSRPSTTPRNPPPPATFSHTQSTAVHAPCIQTHASEFQRLWKLHLSSPSLCAQYTALKTMTPMRTLSYTNACGCMHVQPCSMHAYVYMDLSVYSMHVLIALRLGS